jgi:hypothetical protein
MVRSRSTFFYIPTSGERRFKLHPEKENQQ